MVLRLECAEIIKGEIMAGKHIHMVGVKKKRKKVGKKRAVKASAKSYKKSGGQSTRQHRAGKVTPTIKTGKWA
tara:strand:- start:304 stop:522 length:219 start_codon:yes stop_codon:yes gene_type:complete